MPLILYIQIIARKQLLAQLRCSSYIWVANSSNNYFVVNDIRHGNLDWIPGF